VLDLIRTRTASRNRGNVVLDQHINRGSATTSISNISYSSGPEPRKTSLGCFPINKFCGPPSLLSNGYQGLFPEGKAAGA
jgi:hypothetical protein